MINGDGSQNNTTKYDRIRLILFKKITAHI